MQKFYVELAYEGYFAKNMEVSARNPQDACAFAMVHADDGACWRDTLESSPHWIEAVDGSLEDVPKGFGAAAIRADGALLLATELNEALVALLAACGRDRWILEAVGPELQAAQPVLKRAAELLRKR